MTDGDGNDPAGRDSQHRALGNADFPTPVGFQGAIGFIVWAVTAGCLFVAFLSFSPRSHMNDAKVFMVYGLAAILMFAVGMYSHKRYQWRGFIPGVLIGIGVTCLLPLGLAAILCGHWQ